MGGFWISKNPWNKLNPINNYLLLSSNFIFTMVDFEHLYYLQQVCRFTRFLYFLGSLALSFYFVIFLFVCLIEQHWKIRGSDALDSKILGKLWLSLGNSWYVEKSWIPTHLPNYFVFISHLTNYFDLHLPPP